MGYTREEITSVLMIGELSTVPVLQDTVRRLFPGQLVRCEHALDAAARGAALESVSLTEECIKNDYALHYRDSATGDHRYRFLVRNGSRYPSAGEVARVLISAAYDGQICLGIPLCLIPRNAENGREAGIELVGDPDGGMRLAGPASGCRMESRPVQVNKNEPTLLIATPPARKGEPRFELAFTIDRQRYLCVTVRDLMTGVLVKDAARMYRLI
jgi:molecular chaperone DnaK (HSP70)